MICFKPVDMEIETLKEKIESDLQQIKLAYTKSDIAYHKIRLCIAIEQLEELNLSYQAPKDITELL